MKSVTSANLQEVLTSSETRFARSALRLPSPSAKRIPSVTLDLPDPFGPARQTYPSGKLASARRNDLNPRNFKPFM